MMQHHYIFHVDGRMNVNVSAPNAEIAMARLAGNFDNIVLIGDNPNLEPYEFEPRGLDWLTRSITHAHAAKLKIRIQAQAPKALTRTEELMLEMGMDEATASVLAAMEEGMH